jgi:DNA polymerase-3 subunit alpha
MKTADFVHLHSHSQYSLLDGAQKIEEMVARARDFGMPALAITDHGNLFGAIEFYEAAQKAGVKPIIGMEAYMAPGDRRDRTPIRRGEGAYHLLLLARDETGYRNLMRLSTIGFLEGFYYRPRIDMDTLALYAEGLIGTSACLQGEVARHLTEKDEARALQVAGRFSEILGPGNFFLEIQDHGLPDDQIVNSGVLGLARRLGLPVIATNDCHYLKKEHHSAHDALLCIQTGKTIEETNRLRFDTEEFYMKSAAEMRSLFSEVPDALANTVAVADRCNLTFDFGKTHLPHFSVPDGFAGPDEYLEHLARKGLRNRYGDPGDELLRRLEYELATIRQMDYASYFLIVWDFIHYAKSHGVPVGPGRGSAAGSLVSYCLGITSIDPIRYDLLFERFLNPERISMPDIDVDFSDRGRDAVIKYVVEKYGRESVTQIITFGTMAARAAVRDVGRVLGMTYGEVDRIAKMIPGEIGMTLDKAIEQVPEMSQMSASDPRVGQLLSHARALEGLARHASVHAAGVVIAPGPLTDFVPLFRTNKDEVTTQFDMGSVEKIGLLKMDFLGLRTLTVIEDALALIEQNRGVKLDLDSLGVEDPAVFRLMQNAETVGIFQFESSGMRDYLRKLKPERLEDLIAMNALYRPGPLGSSMIDDFIDRRHGRKKIRYEHPRLKGILEETYGVIVYQEQVMRIASELAGFSLGRADLLRRAMGKKKHEVMAEQREAFVKGCLERGVAKAPAEKIFDLMAHFAGYGFNKSHSAGYAYLAYHTAYLKAHFPSEFLAASMTSEASNSDRIVILMNDARRLGIMVTPPDINVSDEGFTVAGDTIHFGLAAVKNVGVSAVRAIIEARRGVGRFENLYQFCELVDSNSVNRKALESLIQAGAFDSTEGHRAQLMEALDAAIDCGQRMRLERQSGQASLFGGAQPEPGEKQNGYPPLPKMETWPANEILSREKKMLGFYVSGHPLARYEADLRARDIRGISEIAEMSDNKQVQVGGIFIAVRTLTDRNNKLWAVATLEDFEGTVDCFVFADLFQRRRACVQKDALVVVRGRTSEREGKSMTIVADEIVPLSEDMPLRSDEKDPWDEVLEEKKTAARGAGRCTVPEGDLVNISIEANLLDDEGLAALRDTLVAHRGAVPVILHLSAESGEITRLRLPDFPVSADEALIEAIRDRLPDAEIWVRRAAPEASAAAGGSEGRQ